MQECSILVGGQAGDGIRQVGSLVAGMLASLGYRIYFWDDYPSLIRGGHNFSIVRASESKILARNDDLDIIVALNQETVVKHMPHLRPDGIVVYDSDEVDADGVGTAFSSLVKQAGGKPIMRNIAALAATGKILGLDWETVRGVIEGGVKKQTDLNLKIGEASYKAAGEPRFHLERTSSEPLPLIQGNEAIALGAARAGLGLYIAYPMTPASSVLHFLAQYEEELGLVTYHPENEIAAAISAIGGAYAGARTMVGSSGGGFALMVEGLSLCGQSETPVVFIVSQRPGPSTGVPTYTMQGDLGFILNAGHGEFVRFVVAPGDPDEAFLLTGLAMNTAWKHQIPALVITDKNLSESTYSFESKGDEVSREEATLWDGEGDYKRYLAAEDGISPLAFPGNPGAVVKGTSYEHDAYGITTEEPAGIAGMYEKRLSKLPYLKREVDNMEAVKVYGDKKSPTALVTWGSTKGACIEVAEAMGLRVVQPLVMEPFPVNALKEALKGAKNLIGVEVNATGSLARLLACNGVMVDEMILKYDGRPFTIDGLRTRVEEVTK
ncbi:MAG: 2-oxoacid:acceptor oxidoreductase subunit alpha [Candidatus Eisenbacteria bacterium]